MYECQVCEFRCWYYSEIEEHVKSHPYCNVCQLKFYDHPTLRKHLLESVYHNFCGICNLDFWSPAARRQHYLNSTRHNYCGICEQDFSSPAALRGHQQTHLPRDVGCPGCGKNFTSVSAMEKHVRPHPVTVDNFCMIAVCISLDVLIGNQDFHYSWWIDSALLTVSHSGGAGEMFRTHTLAECWSNSRLGEKVRKP